MTADAPNALETSRDLTLRVGDFEGPFDLLLHLCRTNEIDLARLPVRTITDQYVAHLEAIEFRDLETAGAYLVMAATLIYLKSDRKSTRLNSSHITISYAVFCLKKKKTQKH